MDEFTLFAMFLSVYIASCFICFGVGFRLGVHVRKKKQ